MALVGSVCFCTDCGNLLDRPLSTRQTQITCDVCGISNPNKWPTTQTTESRADAFPSVLQQRCRTNIQEIDYENLGRGTLIDNPCPRCQNPQTEYYELQLRSADEGSTIFYKCRECGFQHNTNN